MEGEEKGKGEVREEGKGIKLLFVILLFDLLAFTSILPLFPSILERYAEKDDDAIYNFMDGWLSWFRASIGAPDKRFNSVFFGGLLGSLFSFLQFLSSPAAGALSDVFGRKPLMLLSVSGSLVSYLVWSQATTFSVFLLSRVIGGAAKASVSIATVIVADIYSEKNRSKGMAAVGIAFSVGFLIGPSIGAYFATRAGSGTLGGVTTPAYFSLLLTAVELVLIAVLLPETLPPASRKAKVSEVAASALHYLSPRSLVNFVSLKGRLSADDLAKLGRLSRIYFLYLFIYSGLEFTLSFFTRLQFGYTSQQQGRMYFFAGAIMMVVQGGYVRRLGPERSLGAAAAGLGLLVPAFLLVSQAHSQAVFYSGLGLYSLASGMVVPCVTTLASNAGEAADKGGVVGTFRSLGALARALGPVVASALFWLAGPAATYALGALALVLPLVMLLNSRQLFKAKTQ